VIKAPAITVLRQSRQAVSGRLPPERAKGAAGGKQKVFSRSGRSCFHRGMHPFGAWPATRFAEQLFPQNGQEKAVNTGENGWQYRPEFWHNLSGNQMDYTLHVFHSPSKNFSMERATSETRQNSLLMQFFVDELKDIYWAEKHLVKALPKMEKKATSDELAEAFANHLHETEGHVSRLEQAFEMIGKKATAKKCDAMQGIIEEAEEIISDTKADTMTRDVGLIFAGQKAEHYEIATYGGLITLAQTLGLTDVASLLKQTLKEEKAADEKLTKVAENHVNVAASTEE
jgi:ferritin-like metal-binding protein YciE